jgi:hypothetical protein
MWTSGESNTEPFQRDEVLMKCYTTKPRAQHPDVGFAIRYILFQSVSWFSSVLVYHLMYPLP